MSNPKIIKGTLENERVPMPVNLREKARQGLHDWARKINERQAERLRAEHPYLDEETIKVLINWAWYNVRGSMDE